MYSFRNTRTRFIDRDSPAFMTEAIIEFPVHFNPYRDVPKYFDIYEAYTILNDNKLLEHHFNLSEKLVDNLHSYSSDAQLEKHT